MNEFQMHPLATLNLRVEIQGEVIGQVTFDDDHTEDGEFVAWATGETEHQPVFLSAHATAGEAIERVLMAVAI